MSIRIFGLVTMGIFSSPALAGPFDQTDDARVRNSLETPAFVLPPASINPTSGHPDSGESVTPLGCINISGNTMFSSNTLIGLAKPRVANVLGQDELESLRIDITRHYINHGFVNSGAILEKNDAKGCPNIRIVEGRLAEIRMTGQEELDKEYLGQRLHPDSESSLNARTLRERFLLLLDDPLFTRLNARLVPGNRLGEAILDLEVERAKPYQLGSYANNYRTASTGEMELGLSWTYRNLTGRGDALEGTLSHAREQGNAGRYSVGWQIPVNFVGTYAGIRLENGASSVVEEPLESLGIKSRISSRELNISHVLSETLAQRWAFGMGYSDRQSRTYLDGSPFSFVAGEPNGRTHAKTWRSWLELSLRNEQQVLALKGTVLETENNLQPMTGLPENRSPLGRRTRHWQFQAQYVRAIEPIFARLMLRGTVQGTRDNLLSMDKLSLGGHGTVRGFRENQLVRDQGQIITSELDFSIPNSIQDLKLNIVPFFDYGRGHDTGKPSAVISSLGLALRSKWGKLGVDFSWAKPLRKSEFKTSGNSLQDKGIYLQINYDLM